MKDDKTVVILSDDILLRERLVKRLCDDNYYDIKGVFDSPVEFFDFFENNSCNILIMDLDLKRVDSIGMIEQLKISSLNAYKKVICLARNLNSALFKILEEMNINYCLKKPFNLDYFIEILNRTSNKQIHQNNQETIIQRDVTSIFLDMGVPKHLKGYSYLVNGITSVTKDISLLGEITKELYPLIARNHQTTASRVEQSIRHVIKITWENGNQDELERMFGYRAKQKPCNSEFISTIADAILTKYKNY